MENGGQGPPPGSHSPFQPVHGLGPAHPHGQAFGTPGMDQQAYRPMPGAYPMQPMQPSWGPPRTPPPPPMGYPAGYGCALFLGFHNDWLLGQKLDMHQQQQLVLWSRLLLEGFSQHCTCILHRRNTTHLVAFVIFVGSSLSLIYSQTVSHKLSGPGHLHATLPWPVATFFAQPCSGLKVKPCDTPHCFGRPKWVQQGHRITSQSKESGVHCIQVTWGSHIWKLITALPQSHNGVDESCAQLQVGYWTLNGSFNVSKVLVNQPQGLASHRGCVSRIIQPIFGCRPCLRGLCSLLAVCTPHLEACARFAERCMPLMHYVI